MKTNRVLIDYRKTVQVAKWTPRLEGPTIQYGGHSKGKKGGKSNIKRTASRNRKTSPKIAGRNTNQLAIEKLKQFSHRRLRFFDEIISLGDSKHAVGHWLRSPISPLPPKCH